MVVNSAPLLIFFAWDSPLQRFTGRFDRFEFKSKFKSSRATGLLASLTGLPAGFPVYQPV